MNDNIKAKAKKLNENHERFEVRVFSQTLGRFVSRFKDAIHADYESAKKVVNGLSVLKWEIAGFSKKYRAWHTVDNGNPMDVA